MSNSAGIAGVWNTVWEKVRPVFQFLGKVYYYIKKVIGFICMALFHLRKVFMAIPVVYYAVKLAQYNQENLPNEVAIHWMNFAEDFSMVSQMIPREAAVQIPFLVTIACLVCMFFSRKTITVWAISIFTLVVPILLLLSSQYPA